MLDQLLTIDVKTQRRLIRFGWIAVLLLVALLVISAVERKERSELNTLEVAVEPLPGGELLIDPTDIKQAINRHFGYQLEGRIIADVDVDRVEEALETEPFIEDAEVYIAANDVIHINVEQRAPVLRVIDNQGINYYLDEDGIQMPLSKHFATKVLVVTGSLPAYSKQFLSRKRDRLKQAFELAEMIRADEFLYPLVEQMHFDPNGKITLVPKLGQQQIKFGKYNNAEDKLRRLKIFYKEALPYEGWRKYATINLEYDGQVVCKKR